MVPARTARSTGSRSHRCLQQHGPPSSSLISSASSTILVVSARSDASSVLALTAARICGCWSTCRHITCMSGLSLTLGYALGATGRWLWRYLELPPPRARTERVLTRGAAVICVAVALAFSVAGLRMAELGATPDGHAGGVRRFEASCGITSPQAAARTHRRGGPVSATGRSCGS